jgi:hypothetical protein
VAEGQLGSRQGFVADAPLPRVDQRKVRAATPPEQLATASLGVTGLTSTTGATGNDCRCVMTSGGERTRIDEVSV